MCVLLWLDLSFFWVSSSSWTTAQDDSDVNVIILQSNRVKLNHSYGFSMMVKVIQNDLDISKFNYRYVFL